MADDRAQLLATFAAFPERLAAAAGAVAGTDAAEGDPAEWGPAEIVGHLVTVEVVIWHRRFADLAGDAAPHWSRTEPGLAAEYAGVGLAAVLGAFASARATTVAAIRALDEAGWARTGRHDDYGVLDVAGLLRIASNHDEEHLADIRAD